MDMVDKMDRMDRIAAVTRFMLDRRGGCFPGWDDWKVSCFITWHMFNDTLFVAKEADRRIGLVVIAWPENAADIKARAAAGKPQFIWEKLPTSGDSFLVADVAGDRKLIPEIVRQVTEKWPEPPRRRSLFTYRKEKLKELSWETIFRLSRDHDN